MAWIVLKSKHLMMHFVEWVLDFLLQAIMKACVASGSDPANPEKFLAYTVPSPDEVRLYFIQNSKCSTCISALKFWISPYVSKFQ